MTMTGKYMLVLLGLFSFVFTANPSVKNKGTMVWNNKKCAVALTYDDGLNVHLDKVIPVLDSMGLKGTFYLTGYREGVSQRINDWRKAAANGHELGNHTLFHPCAAIAKGRDYSDWVVPEYDLNNYTVTRIADEIRMANIFLKAIDGKEKRTIAYPCGDCFIKDSTYVPLIRNELIGGRGGSGYNNINEMDIFHIAAIGVDDKYNGEQLIDIVKNARETNTLVAFCFHGVGGEHRTNIALSKHQVLLRFLKENEKDIWVAPLVEIVEYVKNYQESLSSPDIGAFGRGLK